MCSFLCTNFLGNLESNGYKEYNEEKTWERSYPYISCTHWKFNSLLEIDLFCKVLDVHHTYWPLIKCWRQIKIYLNLCLTGKAHRWYSYAELNFEQHCYIEVFIPYELWTFNNLESNSTGYREYKNGNKNDFYWLVSVYSHYQNSAVPILVSRESAWVSTCSRSGGVDKLMCTQIYDDVMPCKIVWFHALQPLSSALCSFR